jgi:TolB protein
MIQERMLAASDCFATPIGWSSDGGKIAYLSGCAGVGSASQLWIVDFREPMKVNVLSGDRITALQWSPHVRVPENIYTN